MASWRYRLFRAGRLPLDYAAVATDPTTLTAVEGVSITARVHGVRAPNRRSSNSIALHSGSLVITPNRLILTIGRRARLDTAYGQGVDVTGSAVSFAVDEAGVHIDIDLARALPGSTGSVRLDAKTPLGLDVLGGLSGGPHRGVASEADVLTITRWA